MSYPVVRSDCHNCGMTDARCIELEQVQCCFHCDHERIDDHYEDEAPKLRWQLDDGGRAAAGYRGETGDSTTAGSGGWIGASRTSTRRTCRRLTPWTWTSTSAACSASRDLIRLARTAIDATRLRE